MGYLVSGKSISVKRKMCQERKLNDQTNHITLHNNRESPVYELIRQPILLC